MNAVNQHIAQSHGVLVLDCADILTGDVLHRSQAGNGHGAGVVQAGTCGDSVDGDSACGEGLVAADTALACVLNRNLTGNSEGAAVVDAVTNHIGNGYGASGQGVTVVDTMTLLGAVVNSDRVDNIQGTAVLDTILTETVDGQVGCLNGAAVVQTTLAGSDDGDVTADSQGSATLHFDTVSVAAGGVANVDVRSSHNTVGAQAMTAGSAVDVDIAGSSQLAAGIVDIDAVAACIINGDVTGADRSIGVCRINALIAAVGDGDVAIDIQRALGNEDTVEQALIALIALGSGLRTDDGNAAGAGNLTAVLYDHAGAVGVVGLVVFSLVEQVADDHLAVDLQRRVALNAVAAVGVDGGCIIHADGHIQAIDGHIAQSHGGVRLVVDGVDVLTSDILDGQSGVSRSKEGSLVVDGVATGVLNVHGAAGNQGYTIDILAGLRTVVGDGSTGDVGDADVAAESCPAVVAVHQTILDVVNDQILHEQLALVVDAVAAQCILDGQIIAGVGGGLRVIGQSGGVDAGGFHSGGDTVAGDIVVIGTQGHMIHHGDAALILDGIALRLLNSLVLGNVVDHNTVAGQLGAALHEDAVVARAVDDHIGQRGGRIAAVMQSSAVGVEQRGIVQIQNAAVVVHQILGGAAVGDVGAVDGCAVQLGIAVVIQSLMGGSVQNQLINDYLAAIAQQQVVSIGSGDVGALQGAAIVDTMLAGVGQHCGAGDNQSAVILEAVGSDAINKNVLALQNAGVVNTMLAGCVDVGFGQLHIAAVVVQAIDSRIIDGQLAIGNQHIVVVDTMVGRAVGSHIRQGQFALVLDAVAALAAAVEDGAGQQHGALIVDTMFTGVLNQQAADIGGAAVVVDAVLTGAVDLDSISSEEAGVVHALSRSVGDSQVGQVLDGAAVVVDTVIAGTIDGHIGAGQLADVVDTMVLGLIDDNILNRQHTAVLQAILALAGVADVELGSGHLSGIVDAVLAGAGNGQTVDHCGAVGVVDAVLGSAGDGHIDQLDGGIVVHALIAHIVDGQASDLGVAAVVVNAVTRRFGHSQLFSGEGALVVDAMVLGIGNLCIGNGDGAAVLQTVLALAGVANHSAVQGHAGNVVDTMLAGAGDGQLLHNGGAIGVVDAVLTGAGDLHIGHIDGAIVVDALSAGVAHLQVDHGDIAMVIVHTVVAGAVDDHILSIQLAGVVETMLLGAGHAGLLHRHGAVVLDTIAVSTGILDGHIGDGHGGLIVDAVLGNILDDGVGHSDHAADLIVDTVHAGLGDMNVLSLDHRVVVDTLLTGAGDLHCIQNQLIVALDQIEAVGLHIGKGAVGNGQGAFGHIATVVAGAGSSHLVQSGGAANMLHRVLLNAGDGHAFADDLAVLIVDTMAAHVGHGHILGIDLAAVHLETILADILDLYVLQIDHAARIQLNSGGADVFNGAVVNVQVTAKGVNAVLLIGGTLNGNVVQNSLAIANHHRLVAAHIQHAAVDGQIAAGGGDVAIAAAFNGQVVQLHVTGEVVHRAGVAADGSEVGGSDLTAVVSQTVDFAGVNSGVLHIQLAGTIVHDAALAEGHLAGIQGAVVAHTVGAVGDSAAGHFGSCAFGHQNAILACAFVGAAGHGKGAGSHIDVMHGSAGNIAAGLGGGAGIIDSRACLSTVDGAAADGQGTVVDNVVAAAFQQAAALNIQRGLLAHDQVGITAVFDNSLLLDGQLSAAFQDDAVDLTFSVDTCGTAEGQAGAVADGQYRRQLGGVSHIQRWATNAPGGIAGLRPLGLRSVVQQDLAGAGDGLVAVDHQRLADDDILGQLNGVGALRSQSLQQLAAILLGTEAVTE